mgnify:CR=1 FL=1
MNYPIANLKPEEIATLKLREIFEEYGYKKYKISRFEEYGLYAANKDFLGGEKVITFTDLDGRLLALKPDVTLSIIKNTRAAGDKTEKLYYIENVYRESKDSHTFKEIPQMGLEYIGKVGQEGITETVALAARTLKTVSSDHVLEISHMDFAVELLRSMKLAEEDYFHLLKLIRNKNSDGIRKVSAMAGLSEDQTETLCGITRLYGPVAGTIKAARKLAVNEAMEKALDQLQDICSGLREMGCAGKIQADLSMVNDIDYYNGIIFRGYLKNSGRNVLAGGQYDRAMMLFGKKAEGIGFALYLNEIGRSGRSRLTQKDADSSAPEDMLNIALPKGRLGNRVYKMLQEAGFGCPGFDEKGRKLIVENTEQRIRFLFVKPSDVAVYVEHHAADIGIVGKDILMETAPDVYELMDLNTGKCRMAVAAPRGYTEDMDRTLRVATKYVNVAKKYYLEKNRDIEIIKLNGSIELGPILGLSDVIVDIVETGSTLRENDLEIIDEFKQISARLIANKSSFKFRDKTIEKIAERLGEVIK